MSLAFEMNLGERGRKMLVDAGHDVATVAEQGLTSLALVGKVEYEVEFRLKPAQDIPSNDGEVG